VKRTTLLLLAALSVLVAGPALAAYPITYSVVPGALASATGPGSAPPGANDFRCRPSKAHPRAVVLLHGFLANQTDNFSTLSPVLANAGYCVFSVTYGVTPGTPFPLDQFAGMTTLERSGPTVAAFVDKVLKATGTTKVDLVGHSEGTIMSRYYTRFLGGAAKVDKVVGLTPLWRGTTVGVADQINVTGSSLGLDPAPAASSSAARTSWPASTPATSCSPA
jgi:triacylglycerol lipase